ncbi:MAG: MATE family efflux transporter [Bacteroidota bacterium]
MTKLASYREILAISLPIMIGSAGQNIITLTDGIFMGRVGETELGAIGFVGIFYLIIAAIGYGFSKGGQIMIARRMGEGKPGEVGVTAYSMFALELLLAIFFFCFMHFGARIFFNFFLDDKEILETCLEYLDFRKWGIFFSYVGVGIVALYTGVARTKVIIYNTILLGILNIILNYGLIFGKWGLPEMGIGGAGLASTVAEMVAFVAFLGYVLLDKKAVQYNLFRMPKADFALIRRMARIGLPVVAQFIVGMGSWFIFFSLVENLGQTSLAAANLVRMVYLVLSIPCWGFASGINTLVSNYLGQNRADLVMPVVWKTAGLSLAITMAMTILVLIFAEPVLLIGVPDNPPVIEVAKPTLPILAIIMFLFSTGGIYFNGIVGTGATMFGLQLQTVCVVLYLIYIYVIVRLWAGNLQLAWTAEILYWVLMFVGTWWYLKSEKWVGIRV